MNTTKREFTKGMVLAVGFAGLVSPWAYAAELTAAEARTIAKEAYIYGYPMVDSYRIQHAYFVDSSNPEFKAPWNHLVNTPRVYTPADTAFVTPNSDTPYSWLGMDLRAEPIVLTMPAVDEKRYYSVQIIDGYTYIVDYIGTRTTGNGAGSYLVAGPGWKGETPNGVKKVIRSDTDFTWGVYRTQLFNPADLDEVKKVQAGYKVQTLSAFLGQPAPAAMPTNYIKPLTPAEQKTSPEFFNMLNFALQFAPTHPSETALTERFARIGVGLGKTIDVSSLSPDMKTALSQGIADAWADLADLQKTEIDTGKVTTSDLFGSRAYLKNNYLYRMAGAVLGIGGNSKQEAMYPIYAVDANGQKLAGANRYTVKFAAGQLPPVNAFWSLTMYELPQSLLVANPIDRYLINSPMLPQLVKDADGGLTLYVQNESPGKDRETNWLPAPKSPFIAFMRLYGPKEAALDGTWKAPPMAKTQ